MSLFVRTCVYVYGCVGLLVSDVPHGDALVRIPHHPTALPAPLLLHGPHLAQGIPPHSAAIAACSSPLVWWGGWL